MFCKLLTSSIGLLDSLDQIKNMITTSKFLQKMFAACFYEFSIWIPNFPKFFNSKNKILFYWWRIHENSGWMVPKSSRRKKVCIFNFLRFHKESTFFSKTCSCRFLHNNYLFWFWLLHCIGSDWNLQWQLEKVFVFQKFFCPFTV